MDETVLLQDQDPPTQQQNTCCQFRHLQNVCMTYWSHMCFSLYLSKEMCIGSFKAFVHALVPPFFVTSSSDIIRDLSEQMQTVGCRQEPTE